MVCCQYQSCCDDAVQCFMESLLAWGLQIHVASAEAEPRLAGRSRNHKRELAHAGRVTTRRQRPRRVEPATNANEAGCRVAWARGRQRGGGRNDVWAVHRRVDKLVARQAVAGGGGCPEVQVRPINKGRVKEDLIPNKNKGEWGGGGERKGSSGVPWKPQRPSARMRRQRTISATLGAYIDVCAIDANHGATEAKGHRANMRRVHDAVA